MLQFSNKENKIIKVNESREIARGGEGRIILLARNKGVAKIFHKAPSDDLAEHFDYLMSWKNDNFLLPSDILYKKKTLAGYIMPFLNDVYQPVSVLFSKKFCRKNGVDAGQKLQLIENLAGAIEQAHKNQIIIGDFNPYNIMLNTQDFSFKIIDTDSFQSPYHRHSGVLLEDVRDYLKGGGVGEGSDFFALSVLAFYMLSFTHPFKGMHPQFKALKDRMLNRLPIFVDGIKRPKCYEALSADFQSVFDDFYLQGKRYRFHLGKKRQPVVRKKVSVPLIVDGAVFIQQIFTGNYLEVDFNQRFGFIADKKHWYLYESIQKGSLVLRKTFAKADFDALYLSEKTVLARIGKQWFWGIEKHAEPIKNIYFGQSAKVVQYGNILTLLSEDALYKLYTDEIVYNDIRIERIEVFEQGFKPKESWIQLSGGRNHIFYNFKGNLSALRINRNVLTIIQRADYGVYTYKEKSKIKHRFFKLQGLKLQEYSQDLGEYFNFDILQNNYLIVAQDDAIEIRNAADMSVLANYSVKEASADSLVFSTLAGIVLCADNGVYVVNKN